MKFLSSLLLLLLAGCTTYDQSVLKTSTEVSTSVSISTSTSVQVSPSGDWNKPEWTKYLQDAIKNYGPALTSGQYPGVCGDRVEFWTALFIAIAKRESSYKASDQMTEDFEDSKGNPQISAGLFQLSLDDAKNNGSACSQFKVFKDILDPKKNIECAVVIMNRWVEKDKVIAEGGRDNPKGAARYWSVIREPDKKAQHYKAEIMARAKASCK